MGEKQKELLRKLPAVHRILEEEKIRAWAAANGWARERLAEEIGLILDELRLSIRQGLVRELAENQVPALILQALKERYRKGLRRVINGTGVLLHTNLGRALMGEAVAGRMREAALFYSNLEYNLEEGKRGSRHDHVERLICRLTGAEAAMVVNNNAAAVFLVLRELARGKEVIVSRGELVEIGGSFRVSEIMAESGARLVEVGTTNKTRLADYERAITPETSLLLKVHRSNFRLIGFTESVSRQELVRLAEKYGLPVYEDLGSGVLYDLRPFGIGDEPVVQEVVASGVDLVSFSGDKLLGGPQAGIIAGKKRWIDRLKRNQLARILRVDKVTLAGLEETLRIYFSPERTVKEIPVLRGLLLSPEEIRRRAETFLSWIRQEGILSGWNLELLEEASEVGGGTLPGVTRPTWAVAVTSPDHSAAEIERALRLAEPPVVARISKERVLLDFRTIQEEEIGLLVGVFRNLQMLKESRTNG